MQVGNIKMQPAASLTAGSEQLVYKLAPADSYTKLLIHGIDNTIADSSISNKTITNSSVTLDPTVFNFPSTSMKFNGSSAYLSLVDSVDWSFGSGDWAIEFWAKFNVDQLSTFYQQWTPSYGGFAITYNNGGFSIYSQESSAGSVEFQYTFDWTYDTNWHHFAFVRSGNSFYCFIDGVSQNLTAYTSIAGKTLSDQTSSLFIGHSDKDGGRFFNGWMQDLRISKGIARYTESFDAFTKLLIHANGANASTGFADAASNKSITIHGNAQISTAQSKFGGSSALFDGTNSYLSLADSDDWDFGTGDFTIDLWVRTADITATQDMCGQWQDGDNRWAIRINGGSPNQIQIFFVNNTTQVGNFTAPVTLVNNVWSHLAFVRNGNSTYIFQDGVSKTVTQLVAWATLPTLSSPLYIGVHSIQGGVYTYYFNGWIDEFRISKGVARWKSNFTPPTAAYAGLGFDPPQLPFDGHEVLTSISMSGEDMYTRLLIHADGADASTTFTDAAKLKTITAAGTAQIDTAQQKFGTGSALFDGNSDYLTLANSPDFAFGTQDFTIDFWVRFNSLTDEGILCYGTISESWRVFADVTNIYFYAAGDLKINIAHGFSINTWYHIAVVRKGTALTMYKNGVVLQGVTNSTSIPYAASTGLAIGWDNFYYFNGWLDEIRISKGIARWTSNFTPPTTNYGINGDTDEEYTLKTRIINGSSGAPNYYVRLNNDDAANYGTQYIYGSNTTTGTARTTVAGIYPGDAAALDQLQMSEFTIYAKSGFVRTILVDSIFEIVSLTVGAFYSMGYSWNNTIDTVTSITVMGTQTGALGVGTALELYAKRTKI